MMQKGESAATVLAIRNIVLTKAKEKRADLIIKEDARLYGMLYFDISSCSPYSDRFSLSGCLLLENVLTNTKGKGGFDYRCRRLSLIAWARASKRIPLPLFSVKSRLQLFILIISKQIKSQVARKNSNSSLQNEPKHVQSCREKTARGLERENSRKDQRVAARSLSLYHYSVRSSGEEIVWKSGFNCEKWNNLEHFKLDKNNYKIDIP